MTGLPTPPLRLSRINRRFVALAAAGAGIALLIAANAHLVYVAVVSQPDCVPHEKSTGPGGTFRAARSAC
ncbi:conserved hypothetical protein [Hyphomicrobiales bacterium]|nr:conserved hypothetical protein [Hyphomicrobiales bacterium]CAH1694855.1 conserved hypothetical protein [Hyphomicrobiales bacterium]